MVKVSDCEGQIDSEKAARSKSEKQRHELQNQIDELNSQLADAHAATEVQVEQNKRHEAALVKAKRDADEQQAAAEANANSIKKKAKEAADELQAEVDSLKKVKAQLEKEKTAIRHEVEEAMASAGDGEKTKSALAQASKHYESQMDDLKVKSCHYT